MKKKRVITYKQGKEMAEAFGFKYFETTIYPSGEKSTSTPFKEVIQALMKDVVTAQNQKDCERDSFTLKNGSVDVNGATKAKGCSC